MRLYQQIVFTNVVKEVASVGEDGLYFCGFWVSPRGAIREITLEAQKIAKAIAKKRTSNGNG